jgi:ankyrin repeat protein
MKEVHMRQASKNSLQLVKRALSAGEISLNDRSIDGSTLLHKSIKGNAREVTEFLVSQDGIDLDAQKIDLWTPLHVAAFSGNLIMIRILLDAGALVGLEDARGDRAFDKAMNPASNVSAKDQKVCVKLLSSETAGRLNVKPAR